MRNRLWVALLSLSGIAALLLAIFTFRYLSDWFNVDACLDKGGSYDYAAMDCDVQHGHEFVAYSARHPYERPAGVIALGVLVVCVTGLGWMRVADAGRVGEQDGGRA